MTMENDLVEPRFAVRLKGAARQLKALREFMGFAGASGATCKAAEATCLAAAARIQALEAELAAALIEVSNQARLRGEAEGKLHVSELAGIVEGWQLRAERAEAELARKTEALRPFANWPVEPGRRDDEIYLASTQARVTYGDFRAARSALEEKTDA